MKGKVKSINSKKQALPFPKLMIAEDGVVVLFQSQGVGVVVSLNGAESSINIGESYGDWLMTWFKDFGDEVIITN